MTDQLYPFLFTPFIKNVMWGGRNLEDEFHMELPDRTSPFGEAWTVCDRTEFVSTVVNGPLAGRTLRQLIEIYGKRVLGDHVPEEKFPLLVKVLDAKERLSLQVHPDEKACAELGNGAEPKTEMWYVLSADKDALIFAGLPEGISASGFWKNTAKTEIGEQLQTYHSRKGDMFFIQAGCIHAIGGGNRILEIQQNSDTTFRVSDWGRLDSNGKSRTLHVEEAKHCVDFRKHYAPKVEYAEKQNEWITLARCPFFNTDKLSFDCPAELSTTQDRSFHLISLASGKCRIVRKDFELNLPSGMTCLVPADFGEYQISGCGEILKTWV